MPKAPPKSPSPARKPRADAQRKRERILEVARPVFTRHGAEATLDDIARQAGIGSGTLYRHFPTRDALIEAVYRSEVEKLTAAGQRFAATMPPLEALRAWMLLSLTTWPTKGSSFPPWIPLRVAPCASSKARVDLSTAHFSVRFSVPFAVAICVQTLNQTTSFAPSSVSSHDRSAGLGAERRTIVDILIDGSRQR